MRKLLTLSLLIVFVINHTSTWCQEKYFVSFTDKEGTPYSINNPNEFLSERSIERRQNQGIEITERDLPVTPSYIQQVYNMGATILYPLKWFNGVVIETDSQDVIDTIEKLQFVNGIEKIFELGHKSTSMPEHEIFPVYTISKDPADYYDYGSSSTQIKMLNGQVLHNLGYRGKGVTIGVLDAGFYKTNTLPAFDSLWANDRVLLTRDFVNPASNLFQEHTHGMIVLSVMAGYIDGQLIGTAPEANYVLIRSEDTNSEQIIEEYNWVAAAELADSIGVDIINSSLGYYTFDAPWQNHSYEDMDGKTTPSAKGANIAAEVGILVVASAGNEANSEWKYIISPADAFGSIAVGAVDSEGNYVYFSSIGPSSDGRIKPDLAALGLRTAVQAPSGQIGSASGTSLSAPVISGLAACLWQAFPNLAVNELSHLMIQSANNFNNPDFYLGYGIPNFSYTLDSLIPKTEGKKLHVFPNPTSGQVGFWLPYPEVKDFTVKVISSHGRVLTEEKVEDAAIYYTISLPKNSPSGMYFVTMLTNNEIHLGKVIKIGD